jgi:outer membrane protein, multidrug efflux system
VLTKLHLAYQQYLDAGKEYARVSQLSDVDQRIYAQISNQSAASAQGVLERVAAQVSAVSTELLRYNGYADLQASLGLIYDSIGLDAEPAELSHLDVTTLSHSIATIMAGWQQGGSGPEPVKPEREPTPAVLTSAEQGDGGIMSGVERGLRWLFGP